MIHIIKDINDPLISIVKDDPVRPDIPAEDRIGNNKEIKVLLEDGVPVSAVCICYQNEIPTTTEELIGEDNPTIAVFYTIWSYKSGAAKKLLFKAKDYILRNKLTVKRFVTLSPKTDMARNFHTKNGAFELSVNETSINYEYL